MPVSSYRPLKSRHFTLYLTTLTILSPTSDNIGASARTEVLYGEEKATDVMVQSFDHAMVGCDVCGNRAAPSFILGSDPLRNALVGLKKRGLRLRYITEITNNNIPYCKELANLVELRHFDGLKGNFWDHRRKGVLGNC